MLSSSLKRLKQTQPTRHWYQKKRFLVPIIFLTMLLAAGGSAAWYVTAKFSTFNTLSTPPPEINGDVAPAQVVLDQTDKGQGGHIGIQEPIPTVKGSLTVLLMGVDARQGEPIDIDVRPDSLFVLHINPEEQTCRTLSIPRDTRAFLPGYGQSKINHALAVGGVPYQILVVEQLLGIRIDHFGLLDFGGLIGVVDAVGGVTVVNDREFTYEGVTFPKGQLELGGDGALLYARFRDDEDGDFGRQRRQQEIVRAVLDQTSSIDAAQAVPDVLGDIDGHFKTDVTATTMVSLINDYRSTCTSTSLETDRLDGDISYDWDEVEKMELSFVHVGNQELSSKVDWLLNHGTTLPAPIHAEINAVKRGVAAALAPRYVHASST